MKNSLGQVTSYTYDKSKGVPLSETDSNSVTTSAEYDGFGRMLKLIRPGDSTSSPTVQISYHDTAEHFYTEASQKLDGSTHYVLRKFYDGLGRPIQTQVVGAEVEGVSNKTIVTNTSYSVNSSGQQVSQSVPYVPASCATAYCQPDTDQPQTITQYDALGRVMWVQEPQDSTTYAVHNSYSIQAGCLTMPGETSLTLPCLVTTSEDRNDNTNGTFTKTFSDALGQTGKVQPAAGPIVTYSYDAAGRMTTAVYGSAITTLSYDLAGRKTAMSDPDMGSWAYSYDALGNLIRQKDGREQRICLYYDSLNRLTGKHYRSDDNCPTTDPTLNVIYTYDTGTYGVGHRTSMKDDSGNIATATTTWEYDVRGRVIKENKVIGSDSYTTRWAYNSADLVTSITYPDNEVVQNTYLPQMVLDTIIGTDTYVNDTQYDAAGRVILRTLGAGVIDTTYTHYPWDQKGGRLQAIQSNSSVSLQDLTYDYDAVGNITSIVDTRTGGTQTQSFTYDDLDRLHTASAVGGTEGVYASETYEYDPYTGNIATKGGADYTYGDTSHVHAVTQIDDGTVTSKTIIIRARKASNLGLMASGSIGPVEPEPVEPVGSTMQLYIDEQLVASWIVSSLNYYNFTTTQLIADNERIDVVCTNCTSTSGLDIDYVTVGSQTVQAEGSATLQDNGSGNAAFDWQNTFKANGTISEPGALRFVVGPQAFAGAYDANGNMTHRLVNDAATIMSYDAENRLVGVSGATTAAFVYNGDGERVKSTVNGTTTAFIGNIFEWTGSTTSMKKYYYVGSQRVAVRTGSTLDFILGDHLGSTSVTTSSTGTSPKYQLYKPWGEVRYTSGTLPTQYTFTGQYSNVADFGLMYYNARYYDPLLGRFSSADPLIPEPGNPQSWDRYAYALNSPLMYTDPSGHMATDDCGADGIYCDKKPTIVTRQNWGALSPGSKGGSEGYYDLENNPTGYALYSDLKPDETLPQVLDSIVIHHEGNNQTNDVAKVQENEMNKGYYDIAYHYVIGRDGTIFEGRDIRVRGAHVEDANSKKIGILWLGDFEPGMAFENGWHIPFDPDGTDIGPTPAQIEATMALVVWLDDQYGIDKVYAHRDINRETVCPGDRAMPYIPMFKKLVR